MDYLLEALSYVSLTNIWQLDWMIKGPGLAIIAILLLRAAFSLVSFRLIKCLTSLIYAFVFALILSRAGFAIQSLLLETPAATST